VTRTVEGGPEWNAPRAAAASSARPADPRSGETTTGPLSRSIGKTTKPRGEFSGLAAICHDELLFGRHGLSFRLKSLESSRTIIQILLHAPWRNVLSAYRGQAGSAQGGGQAGRMMKAIRPAAAKFPVSATDKMDDLGQGGGALTIW
jgi:hypothetical protein